MSQPKGDQDDTKCLKTLFYPLGGRVCIDTRTGLPVRRTSRNGGPKFDNAQAAQKAADQALATLPNTRPASTTLTDIPAESSVGKAPAATSQDASPIPGLDLKNMSQALRNVLMPRGASIGSPASWKTGRSLPGLESKGTILALALTPEHGREENVLAGKQNRVPGIGAGAEYRHPEERNRMKTVAGDPGAYDEGGYRLPPPPAEEERAAAFGQDETNINREQKANKEAIKRRNTHQEENSAYEQAWDEFFDNLNNGAGEENFIPSEDRVVRSVLQTLSLSSPYLRVPDEDGAFHEPFVVVESNPEERTMKLRDPLTGFEYRTHYNWFSNGVEEREVDRKIYPVPVSEVIRVAEELLKNKRTKDKDEWEHIRDLLAGKAGLDVKIVISEFEQVEEKQLDVWWSMYSAGGELLDDQHPTIPITRQEVVGSKRKGTRLQITPAGAGEPAFEVELPDLSEAWLRTRFAPRTRF